MLLPDETLYSWCGHVHLWNGNASVLDTSRQLFGKPYSALLHDFPAFLNRLQKITGGFLPSSTGLALDHTLLGYFLAFQPRDFTAQILYRISHSSYSQLKFKLGIAASRVGGSHPLKYCQRCLSDDFEHFGRGCWHVQHQYPSVFVCPSHREPLWVYPGAPSPVHLRQWLFLETHVLKKQITIANNTQNMRLLKLAQFSLAAAKLPAGTLIEQTLA